MKPSESQIRSSDDRNDPVDWGRRPVLVEWLLVCALIVAGLVVGKTFLVPLALAVLIWSLINVLKSKIAKIRVGGAGLPRPLCLALAILFIALANLVVYGIISAEVPKISAALPQYRENLTLMMERLASSMPGEFALDMGELVAAADLWSLIPWLGGQVSQVASDFLIVLIYVGFLLAEQDYIQGKLTAVFQKRTKSTTDLILNIVKQVNTYLSIKTLVSLATGLLSYLVFVWFGLDFAPFWALIVFILNFIPTVGSIVAVILPSMLALMQFETLPPVLAVVVLLSCIQFIVGNVVEPALTGHSLNMSPFGILLALSFWGLIWGIPGMFLSVPITVAIAIICSNFSQLRWIAILISKNSEAFEQPEKQNV